MLRRYDDHRERLLFLKSVSVVANSSYDAPLCFLIFIPGARR